MIEAETLDGGNGDREVEEDWNIRPRSDPFKKPPILKVLFEQLLVKDLVTCRLVSRLWYNVSLSTWRAKVTLKFEKERIVSTWDDGSSKTSLREFLDLWDQGDWGSCPFKKFSLHRWNFKTGDLEQVRFLKLVASHITSLTLKECSFEGRDNFQRIMYQVFPNLQFLKLETCSSDGERTEKLCAYKEPAFGVHGLKSLYIIAPLPDSMMNILSHFHKVRSLQLQEAVRYSDYRRLLETIKLIRAQDRQKLPLKNFDVGFYLHLGKHSTSSMELLRLNDQLNLPLLRLWIWSNPEVDMDSNFKNILMDILQHHSSTLTHIVFSGDGPSEACKSFPFGFNVEKLKNIFIRSPRFSNDLNYLRYTPNLTALHVHNTYENPFSIAESDELFSHSPQLETGGWTLPTLTYLKFLLPLSACNLGKLLKRMPNVERLWLVLDDVKFSMVCKTWKHLKYVRDCGTELTDEGVIGTEYAHEAGGNGEIQSRPNVTKLQYLTGFRTRSSRLTSASIHEGFLKVANLKQLSLGHSTQLDDEARAALERQEIKLDR